MRILPISEKQLDRAEALLAELKKAGLRAELDRRNEKVGYKIREAQLEKVPYMLVLGDKEVENGTVSVRSRQDGDKGSMKADDFIAMALDVYKRQPTLWWLLITAASPTPDSMTSG